MSRLTRDGTAEPVSRDQIILRHARGLGSTIFPVQLTTSRIGNLTRLIHTLLYVMTIHTYIQRMGQFWAWMDQESGTNRAGGGVYEVVKKRAGIEIKLNTWGLRTYEKKKKKHGSPTRCLTNRATGDVVSME